MGKFIIMNFTPVGKPIPDVSFYQDDNTTPQQIDFNKMKSAGVEGVIIRAGQNTWVDPDFAYNWSYASLAGLKRGAYWFLDTRSDPVEQAKRFVNLFALSNVELGLWVDLEYTEQYGGTGPYNKETDWIKFCDVVRANNKSITGVYTANWWWRAREVNQEINRPDYWRSFPLWVAGYNDNPLDVNLPSCWDEAVLWQYTSKGNGPTFGVESLSIDLNYGSQKFYDMLSGAVTPPIGGTMKVGTVKVDLNLRTGVYPAPVVTLLHAGDKVYGVIDTATNWMNVQWIVRANGTQENIAGWCSCNSAYIDLADYVPPVTTPKHVVELYVDGNLKYREELN